MARPHGVKGELSVQLHWPESRALYELSEITLLGPNGEQHGAKLLGARPAGKRVLVRLEGCADRNAAAHLRGHRIAVLRSALPEPEAGEFYLCDLVGARVMLREQGGGLSPVGDVASVRSLPSVDVLVVRAPDGSEKQQPLGEPFIESVDAKARLVVLRTADALL